MVEYTLLRVDVKQDLLAWRRCRDAERIPVGKLKFCTNGGGDHGAEIGGFPDLRLGDEVCKVAGRADRVAVYEKPGRRLDWRAVKLEAAAVRPFDHNEPSPD